MRIGIRREDKNEWEARVPVIPADIKKLTNNGINVVLQPSPIRIFSDQEYIDVGAIISEDLSSCSVIMAVKEIPVEFVEKGKTYIFFSHTIKGQAYNMPLLQKMIDEKTQLIDYERIVNDQGQRLIFFGRHAGLAGMIDSLWAFGKRLDFESVQSPFSKIKKTFEYRGLKNAKEQIGKIADEIIEKGIPKVIRPLICGFSGYGNVSQGAQEIFDILPHQEISAQELSNSKLFDTAKNVLHKVVFKESDLVEPISGTDKFELQDYYNNPEKYRSKFEQYLSQITILMNCIYWDTQYPRLITKNYLKTAWLKSENQKLKVIGDISCDIDGAIQCTLKSTEPGNPVYVYNPINSSIVDGVEGAGPVIMAVDNLPCELAEEASKSFSKILVGFIPELVKTDYHGSFESLKLASELRKGMILYKGKLTSEYRYLEQYL
ncbi:MAG: bifunctional lysine ketoglutarate reductase /saccharopine dehydrogenase family protein [Candidatus Neomarinimicrobiota bacterium]